MKLLAVLALSGGAYLYAQNTPEVPLNERVMVVYNSMADDSRKVAQYYMEKRNIPKENLCKISTMEPNSWDDDDRFEDEIGKTVRSCLKKMGKEKILYIVLTYGVPFEAGFYKHRIATDSWIADIWNEYAKPGTMGRETGDQPYYGQAQSQGNVYEPYVSFAKYRDRPLAKTIYSVWRIDAPTPELAKGLVDKALYAEAHGLRGNAYFDMRSKVGDLPDFGYGAGNWDVYRSSEMAKRAGFDVTLDDKETEFGTAPSQMRCENAALYAGWYSLGHYNDVFSWAPGAIGFHLDSASAAGFRTGTSWVAGALRRGITVTSGAITEPFLEGMAHPDQVFFYVFQGANVGDAVLRSTRWLKWLILNVGDPLYRPFPNGAQGFDSKATPQSWFGAGPSVVGNGAARAQFFFAGKRDKDVPLVCKSNYPKLVTLPANITLPPNATGGRFQIRVKAPDQITPVVITVSDGDETLSNTIVLYPLLAELTLSRQSMKSGETITGKVLVMVPAGEGGFTVKLTASQAVMIIPDEIKIPAGAREATFPITAKPVTAEATATITAKLDDESKVAQLKITP